MYIAIGWVSTVLLILYLKRENRMKAAGKRDVAIGGERPADGMRDGKRWFATEQEAVRSLWSGLRCSR
jgi:hypothetical protein